MSNPEPYPVRRPFEDQTYLERTLRSHLYHPETFLAEADDRIKKAAKKGDYDVAAALQKQKSTAKLELETWKNLLDLYEQEFQDGESDEDPEELICESCGGPRPGFMSVCKPCNLKRIREKHPLPSE